MMDYSKPSPNLNTILMVEHTLKEMDESVISVAKLKKKLPKQVNHQILMVVLDYLEESNKIHIGTKGISWIHSSPEALHQMLLRSTSWNDLVKE
ncbi:MAG: hypothetical protein ACLFSN_03130 [Candidatus Woesearchaeota archaeon]